MQQLLDFRNKYLPSSTYWFTHVHVAPQVAVDDAIRVKHRDHLRFVSIGVNTWAWRSALAG